VPPAEPAPHSAPAAIPDTIWWFLDANPTTQSVSATLSAQLSLPTALKNTSISTSSSRKSDRVLPENLVVTTLRIPIKLFLRP